ncbi:MAG: hypothetical protein C0413_01870 [Clostridiales bacterium]|nr:hypothetical protein [Clostridiales bacterium]
MSKNLKYSHPFFAPFEVMKREKSHLIWLIVVLFFGAVEILGPLLEGNSKELAESIEKGILYTFAVAFCAPFFPSLLIQFITKKRSGHDVKFANYKICIAAITVLFLFVTLFLFEGKYKASLFWQIVSAFISVYLAFYIYCIGEMELHEDIVEHYDMTSYKVQEAKRMVETSKKSKQISGVEDGVEF